MTSDSEEQPESGEGQPEEEATDMAALLDQSEEFRSPQRGEIVDGVVMGWDRDGALVDIRAKSEGLILRHEMQSLGSNAESQLEPGTKVLVYIVHSETADGQIVLSIDKARGEQGWLTLQDRFESGETFEAEVTGFNKGGLLANVEGVNAFVPLSQVVGVRPDRGQEDGGENSLASAVGRTLRLKVIEINRRRNRVILSERAALQEWRMAQKERLIQELHEGDIRKGRVSSVRNFGVFIDLGGADGLAHLSELSWERDKTPNELFKVGDEVDVYVTKIDAENKKIALSMRRANPGPWEAVVDKYNEGQVVTGLVTKLVTFGAFARIEGPVEGLIHVSELVDRRIGHPREVAREGDLLPLKIVRIERDRHRLGLSLRRARDEGEQMGYVFSEGGEVLTVPDDIRDEFIAREGPIPTPPPAADEPAEGEPPSAIAAAATDVAPAADAAPAETATEEETPAAEPAAEQAPTAEAEPAAEEAPAAEAEPAAEEAPAAEAEPAAEEAPAAEAEPATEEAPAAEAEPATEEAPAAEAEPATEEEPAAEAEPAEDKAEAESEETTEAGADTSASAGEAEEGKPSS
ncbi:MAG: S1 RNA-binding domain-containing protein [Chloroflexi bacterium]|nr:S1 RNA-binding domain-containing protein [Chloroflexota bacterium]